MSSEGNLFVGVDYKEGYLLVRFNNYDQESDKAILQEFFKAILSIVWKLKIKKIKNQEGVDNEGLQA